MSFLEVRGISKSFPSDGGARHVLRDVSLSVAQGEFISIVGSMGSGKSTLLSLLAGLTHPDAGTISIDGEPLREIRTDAAYVFQNYSLLPWFTAAENVHLAVVSALPTWSRDQQTRQTQRYLDKVGLAHAAQRRPSQLSGGMRQRVALARALATEPDLLFLDDPFGALDALTRANLQQELAQLCSAEERPVTTIMITNHVEEALLLSDRIVPMTHGPRATLGRPVAVSIPRPRTLAQLAHDRDAMHSRNHVVESLTMSVRRRRQARISPAALDDVDLNAVPQRSEA